MDKNKIIGDYIEKSLPIKLRNWREKFQRESIKLEYRLKSAPTLLNSPEDREITFSFSRFAIAMERSLIKTAVQSPNDTRLMIAEGLSCLLSAYFTSPILGRIIKDGFHELPVMASLAKQNIIDLREPSSWYSWTSANPDVNAQSVFNIENLSVLNYLTLNRCAHLYPVLCRFESEIYWNLENYKIAIDSLKQVTRRSDNKARSPLFNLIQSLEIRA